MQQPPASLSVGFAVPAPRHHTAPRRNCSKASLLSQSLALNSWGSPQADSSSPSSSSTPGSPASTARGCEAGTPPPAVELESEASMDLTAPVTINYDR